MRAPSFSTLFRIAAATVVATAAALASASPAQAIPSGNGWAASWSYDATDHLEYQAKLPGVTLTGHASDVNGVRTAFGELTDTSADGRCAVAKIYSGSYLADRTICGSGKHITFSTSEFSGPVLILICRKVDGAANPEVCVHQTVPSSAADPTLRNVGAGTSWSYYNPTSFTYSARRWGVQVTGYGSHKPGEKRSGNSLVTKTSDVPGCVSGKTSDFNSAVSGSACTGGAKDDFGAQDFTGWIQTEACTKFNVDQVTRCVTVHVPQPY